MKFLNTFVHQVVENPAVNRMFALIEQTLKNLVKLLSGNIGLDNISEAALPWVDIRYYASFSAAITAIGAVEKTLLIPNEQAVAADKTVPANVTLKFLQGGCLNIATTKTVTINGHIDAGLHQIFKWAGTGKVVFGTGAVEKIYPQWWGAKGDGVTDATDEIQATVNSLSGPGGTIFFPDGSYLISDPDSDGTGIVLGSNLTLIGNGPSSYIYTTTFTGGNGLNMIVALGKHDITVENLYIKNTGVCNTAPPAGDPTGLGANVLFIDCDRVSVRNCLFTYGGVGAIYFMSSRECEAASNFVTLGSCYAVCVDNWYVVAPADESEGASIHNNVIWDCSRGIAIDAYSSAKMGGMTVADNIILYCGYCGIAINSTSGVTVTGNVIDGDHTYRTIGATGYNCFYPILVQSVVEGPSVRGLNVSGNSSINTEFGFYFANIQDSVISNNNILNIIGTNIGGGGPTQGMGIYFFNWTIVPFKNVVVEGNNIQFTGSGTTVCYGIFCSLAGAAGTMDNISITNNSMLNIYGDGTYAEGIYFNAGDSGLTRSKISGNTIIPRSNAEGVVHGIGAVNPIGALITGNSVFKCNYAVKLTSDVKSFLSANILKENLRAYHFIGTCAGTVAADYVIGSTSSHYGVGATDGSCNVDLSRTKFSGIDADKIRVNGTGTILLSDRRSAVPSSGYWGIGDIVWNTAPGAGTPLGWICTVAGNPGTWTAIVGSTQEVWIAPTLLNSWVNYGGSLDVAGYMKDNLGFVHLKGCVKTGAIGTVVFNLPAGYRPGKHQSFAVACSSDGSNLIFGAAHIYYTDGSVYALNGANNQFYFDGIVFRAEN